MEGPIILTPVMYVIFGIAGWCATVPPPHVPLPGSDPDPDPLYWQKRMAGLVGGLIAGWLLAGPANAGLFTAMVGAFLGGRVAADLDVRIMRRGR